MALEILAPMPLNIWYIFMTQKKKEITRLTHVQALRTIRETQHAMLPCHSQSTSSITGSRRRQELKDLRRQVLQITGSEREVSMGLSVRVFIKGRRISEPQNDCN